MSDSGTLNRLAFELSLEERKGLLEKLNSQSNISQAPLYSDVVEDSSVNMEDQYTQLPWYYRLLFFLWSIFKNKPPVKVYEDREVVKLGKRIEAQNPGMYDYTHGLLLPAFYKALLALKEGARFFFAALDTGVNRDKGGFYAFLGSLEMGDVHKRLTTTTDPEFIVAQNPDVSDTELRQSASRAMEDAMAAIPDEQRNRMYANARSINCLIQLSSFLFDRVLLAFSMDQSRKGMVCAGVTIKDQLSRLNNILCSLTEIPSMALLESLFIFIIIHDRAGEPGFEINVEMRNLLSRAEKALAAIRDFNTQVPLTLILRCAGRDMSFSPKIISGGEEWFAVYREHWKRQVETMLSAYVRRRRMRNLQNTFRQFLKGVSLKPLDHVESESNPQGLPVPGTYNLAFLLTFHAVVLSTDINTYLRPILLDGEFSRRENRTEFTEYYNDLMKLDQAIRKFDASLSPEGDYGKPYLQVRGEMVSPAVKRRKMQVLIEDATAEVDALVERSRNAITGLINILNGILKKETGGKYDALTNFSALAGKGDAFAHGLDQSLAQLRQALSLIDEIQLMESEK
jgi:hypothetical protein